MTGRLEFHSHSHPGTVRPRNEDAFVERADIGLWAVADGAGGYGTGDVASGAIAAALRALPTDLSAPDLLVQVRQCITDVHADLQQRAQSGGGRPIASTVVILLARAGHFACLWAGDSRAYLLRDGIFSCLTKDHSVVQELVDSGLLEADQAESHPMAHVITRAVGGDGELELDKVSAPLIVGDKILLCSDGLFKALSMAEIAAMLPHSQGAEQLIAAAVANGAKDNVTAVTVCALD